MFDIHCHILPGIDDGADILADTIKMAEIAVGGRCSGIICTPHFTHRSDYDHKMLPYVVSKLSEVLTRHKVRLAVYPGMEILLDDLTADMLIGGELLTLNSSRYALVEFQFDIEARRAFGLLDRLTAHGIVPVVAHPERYDFVNSRIENALELRDMGCVLQLNKGSYKGAFGDDAYFAAKRLTELGLADIIASDAHGPYVRTPCLSDIHELVSSEWSLEYADLLLKYNPFMVISDRPIKRHAVGLGSDTVKQKKGRIIL